MRDKKRHYAYVKNIPYRMPACYILGISYEDAHDIHPTWIGHADDLQSRLHSHAVGNKNTGAQMKRCIKSGFKVWFKHCKARTTGEAEDIENALRKKEWWKYSWNVQGMPF